jgi:hypothetical protein
MRFKQTISFASLSYSPVSIVCPAGKCSGGEFEEELTECNWSDVVVWFGYADEDGGGEEVSTVGRVRSGR